VYDVNWWLKQSKYAGWNDAVVVSMLRKRKLHTVGTGRPARAVPRVSVDPVMIVLSGHSPVTLRVASEAWKLNGCKSGWHSLHL
jgi:hypothetical protein